jgi:titin
MPFDKPGVPTGISATADDMQINVSWVAPGNNGGSEITGYIATATGGFSCSAPSSATSCSIRGLTNGNIYSVKVAAINAAGVSADGSFGQTVVPRGVSVAPTNIAVTPLDKSLLVKWKALTSKADTNGAVISKYKATASPSGLSCTVDGYTNNVANTTCTITGLTNGLAQTVTVVAINDAGTSNNSSSALGTPRSAPGVPQGVTVTPLDNALSISWLAPADSGGVPITKYIAIVTAVGVTGSAVSQEVSGDARNSLITNLANGTQYTVTVKARNEVGDGNPSAALTVAPATVPSKPSKPWLSVGNGQISIRWSASQDNGAPVTSYHVSLEPGGYSCDVTDLSFLGCTIADLDNGVPYSVAITATNDAGDSEPAGIDGTATPRAIPSAVQLITVNASNGQATVSWVEGFNGGSPIQSFQVTASPGGSVCQALGTSSQCVVKNLVNGTQYTFKVVAVNSAGSSQPLLSAKTLIAGTPNAPVALKVKPADGKITVSFAPPAVNGGNTITSYTVYVNDEVGCTVAPAKTLGCTISDLENGTPQVVRVVANNQIGASVSTPEVVVTPGRVADAVTNVTATTGVGSLTISWTEPENDGGSPITGYAVTLTPGGKTCKTTAEDTSCEIAGLTLGTSYVAKVVAINGVGTSAAASSPATKVVGPPSVVRNLSATALAKGAKIYFAAPASNGGAVVTDYYFSVTGPNGYTFDSGPVSAAVAKSSYALTGLTKGLTYTISVTCENDYGMSAAVTVTVKSK